MFQAITAILITLPLIFGGQWLYAKYEEWMESLTTKSREQIRIWFWTIIEALAIVAVGLGVQFDILSYWAWFIPIAMISPLLIGIIIGWWNFLKYRGQKLTDKNLLLDQSPLDIFKDAVIELGCQPTLNEDGSIDLSYQGENFHVEFGGMYARVWDPMWSGIKADDLELPKVRDAMNSANFNFGPTVVMTAPNEEGVIGFHSRRDIMLHPACPDNVPFVKAVLDSFFDIKEQMRSNYQQLTIQQTEKSKNRRPVGFTTNQES